MREIKVIIRDDFRIKLVASSQIINRVCASLEPYFIISDEIYENEDVQWIIEEKNNRDVYSDFLLFSGQSVDSPTVDIYVNEKSRHILVDQNGDWLAMYIIRFIRSMFRWHYYEVGAIFLHGAFFSIENRGLAVLGNKKSGKTTTLLTMLSLEQCKYITNDDLSISPFCTSDVVGLGWPRTLCIRNDSMELVCKKFHNIKINQTLHPGNRVIEKSKQYMYITPKELVGNDIGKISSQNKLDIIIFTEFVETDRTEIFKIDKETAMKKLCEHQNEYPEKYFTFLQKYFKMPDIEKRAVLFDRILDSVQFYQLNQSFNKMENTRKIIASLVGLII